jgi:hypothetical protein
MATTTPNFGFDVPTSTDYVKDGATAIETLGDDIDDRFGDITNFPNQLVNKVSGVSRPIPFSMSAGICTATSGGTSVTFPASRFTQAPIMTLQRSTARGGFQNAESITTSGFIAYSFDYAGTGNTATNTNWIAIQMKSATAAG